MRERANPCPRPSFFTFICLFTVMVGCRHALPIVWIPPLDDAVIHLHLFDFEGNPYTEISIHNIDSAALCRVELTASSQARRDLLSVFSGLRAGNFDPGRVRLKIVDGVRTTYVDVDGGVWGDHVSREAKLPTRPFRRLREIVENAPEFEGCLIEDRL